MTVERMSFAQFVDAIEATHGFARDKRQKLVQRLQQLQKMGLSKGTGRGQRATYGATDVADMSFMIAMLDQGISPAEALRRLRGDTSRTLDYLR